MVSVDVTELAPGVTEDGESPQVGTGAGPLTAHVSAMALANPPFIPASIITSVPWPPRDTLTLVEAGLSEKSCCALKFAVTEVAILIVTVHAAVPEQAPPQPAKLDVEFGVAVNVTAVPEGKFAEHASAQLIPAGLLLTLPPPFPSSVTLSAKPEVNVAVTVRLEFMVIAQSIMLAVQPPPLQPANTEPGSAAAPRTSVAPAG